MSDIETYVNVVHKFNDIKSFVITLPSKMEIYERLIPHIDDVIDMTHKLLVLEENRQNVLFDSQSAAIDIIKLVVHLNQISNGVK